MNYLIDAKLETLKDFQDTYPTAHVGGSIGLYLRGVNLLRDLTTSDLDITIDEIDLNAISDGDHPAWSGGHDFDYSFTKTINVDWYVKIDIRICPEPSFDEVLFEGVKYNVSKYRDIIFWKTKYAHKGVKKHIADLEVIKTGIRPLVPIIYVDVDLPF